MTSRIIHEATVSLALAELPGELPAMDGVQLALLEAAKRMFLEQGYLRTSLKKIAMRANVQPEAVASAYKTKDDVFTALASRLLLLSRDKVHRSVTLPLELQTFEPQEMLTLYRYLLLLALAMEEVDSDALLCSLYQVEYTTPVLFEKMVDRQAAYAYSIFAQKFTGQECYERTLVIQSAIGGYIQLHRFRRLMPREQLKKMVLRQALELYDVPENQITKLVQEVMSQKLYLQQLGRELIEEL